MGDTVTHIFSEKQSDFYEMLLHHLCACSLLFLMLFSNYLGIGCIVVFAHDISDILVSCVKFFSCTDYELPTMLFFFLVVASWIYTRNGVLTYISTQVWQEVWLHGGCLNPLYPEIDLIAQASAVMLTVLSCLQWYWLYLFYDMLRRYLSKGETEDIQST